MGNDLQHTDAELCGTCDGHSISASITQEYFFPYYFIIFKEIEKEHTGDRCAKGAKQNTNVNNACGSLVMMSQLPATIH